MPAIAIVRSANELRRSMRRARGVGAKIALAPTMGALHPGHLSLIALAAERADFVAASVFVNPTQFGPNEDFHAYPRDEARDIALLTEAGCDLVYAPLVEAIYPEGFATTVSVAGVTAMLEGVHRPGHFAGVATVVAKLLIQAEPDVAVFGEKDFQQLQLIRRLVRDLDLPVEIVGAPIIRDIDGLALSSRNAYLTAEERRIAPALYGALARAAADLAAGAEVAEVERRAVSALGQAGFANVDYFEARRPDDLARLGPGPIEGPARLLAAARIGRTRLIDNLAV